MTLCKRFIVFWLQMFSECIMMPTIRWAMPVEMKARAALPSSPVASDAAIDLLVFSAALEDHLSNPDECQPTLNACLNGLHQERLGNVFISSFAGMVAKGVPFDEAFHMVCANAICVGMHLQRRLS